mmetsp:Transcript_47025/g.60446  ORF Transcript_47025/g.60446 Transcript_47025/m.60446 type:complete len:702 (+) Transcript_47025:14-2119(+)
MAKKIIFIALCLIGLCSASDIILDEDIIYHTPNSWFDDRSGQFQEYQENYTQSIDNPRKYWANIAKRFVWKGLSILDSSFSFNFDKSVGPIFIEWFKGSQTNLAYNALDLNIQQGLGDKVALYYEKNNEEEDKDINKNAFTYLELKNEVNKLANALREQGVKKGDRVAIFMAHIPENCMAMLACARIGAIHSVIFGGFSNEALASRILNCGAKVVITQDGVMRGSKLVNLKETLDNAIPIIEEAGGTINTVIVFQRLPSISESITMVPHRDYWWHDVVSIASVDTETEWVDAEHPSFILYTSGSTGKPKGIQHSTGGYMVGAAHSFKNSFGHQLRGDVYFCSADYGWITGHTYGTYGPLLNGATQVVFEGLPMWPQPSRIFDVIDKFKVSHFYTAPTLLRALMGVGEAALNTSSRSSLRLLATVGEPINPEVWKWFFQVVGSSKCPVVDTWWQTETGAHVIAPLPLKGWNMKPGSASLPSYGMQPCLLDPISSTELTDTASEGWLAVKYPWPSALRGVWEDYQRFEDTYFPFNGYYLTGDGARRDKDGHYWITGRVDDVMIVSGHNIGSAEVESAVVKHPLIAEAAVVGKEHSLKGQSLYVFVTPANGFDPSQEQSLKRELKLLVRSEVGAFASPDDFQFSPTGLPKTRSGKIMRRILRKIANEGGSLSLGDMGDISTLSNPNVVLDLLQTVQSCESPSSV